MQREAPLPETLSQRKLREAVDDIQLESARYNNTKSRKPWMSEAGDTVIWSTERVKIAKVIVSQQFEALMGFLILANIGLIVYETNYRAQCYPDYTAETMEQCPWGDTGDVVWLSAVNLIFLLLYTLECLASLFAFRLEFFATWWNLLDLFVVVSGWFEQVAEGINVNTAILRIFRIARLMRAFRIVLTVRELYMLISGLASSMRAMFFGMVLLFGMLFIEAIIVVEFVHPVNALIPYEDCERCPRGFASVEDTVLTLFQQIVTGDSWGLISVPVIEEDWRMAPILIIVFVSIALCVMNLILAVIVESAAEAREKDMEERTRQKQQELLHVKIQLLRVCEEMDKDGSGSLNLSELVSAWDDSREFRQVMVSLEVRKDELEGIFTILDKDQSGEVDYKEFVDQLYQLSTCDTRMMLALIRLDVSQVKVLFDRQVHETEEHITGRLKAFDDTLSKHSSMLESMQRQLVSLCVAQGCSEAVVVELKEKKEVKGVSNVLFSSRQEPADPLTELGNLRQYARELSGLSSDIVRRAEEQAGTLLRQADLLAQLHEAASSGPVAGDGLELLGQKVGQVRRYVCDRMATLVQDLERKVDEEAGALLTGTRLLENIACDLGVEAVAKPSAWRMAPRGGGLGVLSAHPFARSNPLCACAAPTSTPRRV